MKTSKLLRLLSIVLITSMLGNMVLLPGSAQARSQAAPPAVASVVTGGERFMDAAPQALGSALQLAQLLDYISQVKLNELNENTLIQARQHALTTAEQAATAQGAVGAIVSGLAEQGYQVQASADMDNLVADLQTNGFDAELTTTLADFGLTSTQIDNLEAEAADNFSVRRSPLPAETVTLLQDAGLAQAEIEQVEETLADYGLADDTLPDRLAQFRASQEEMSIVRTEALVAYLQLLTKQVFVRQLAGQTGRDLTSAEVDEVIKDQLRLLIHTGYLDSLGDPDPDVGEGQWLFVERYSLRVAERLDALILDTQNVGLIVDLLLALQIHSTALAALAGDANYAKTEMDPLADFLATLLGDNLPSGLGYRQATPPFWWASALALGDYNPARLANYEPEPASEAVAVAEEQVQGRIKGLASPLWFQTAQGVVPEYDETNNEAEAIFYTNPPELPPGVLEILLLHGATITQFLWQAATGQTENPYAIGGNVVLGFWPITGILVDILGLYYEPDNWGKAFAFIGLVASLLTEGEEALAIIGASIPLTLIGTVPAAILLEVLDGGASILKNARHFVSSTTYRLLKDMRFDKILKLGGDILWHLARRAVTVVGEVNWPSDDMGAILNILQDLLSQVWDPFVAWLAYVYDHLDELDEYYELGFGEGAYLAARALNLSDEIASYTPDIIRSISKIGDELAEAGIELSDEATEGLGELAKRQPEDHIRKILYGPCPVGLAQVGSTKIRGLASPLLIPEVCKQLGEEFLTNYLKWDVQTHEAFDILVEAKGAMALDIFHKNRELLQLA